MKPTDPPALATALLELLIPPRTPTELSGWTVSRTHSRPMVLVFAICYAMALPMPLVVAAVDFIIAPIGVLASGLLDASRATSHGADAH